MKQIANRALPCLPAMCGYKSISMQIKCWLSVFAIALICDYGFNQLQTTAV